MSRKPHFVLSTVCAVALVVAAGTMVAYAQAPVVPEGIPTPGVNGGALVDDTVGYPPEQGCCELPKCHYNPCFKYVGVKRLKRVCCKCGPTALSKVALEVKDPGKCGCIVEVPICIPTCCEGEPCVKDRCGAFGRGVVWYKWCCGFKVRVVFSGDGCKGRNVTVTYFAK
jgi:hypothetical protein